MLLYILLQSQNVYAVSFIGEEENKKKNSRLDVALALVSYFSMSLTVLSVRNGLGCVL